MTQSILIVEDETRLAELLADYLVAEGFAVSMASDGLGVVERVRREPPDLMVLDLMLPGVDGISICREVRAFSDLPIIMTTARVEEIDRLLGLEFGADDYVCKPYSPRELVARVKAVLRRSAARPAAPSSAREMHREASGKTLELLPDQLRVRANGREIELSLVEFALLQVLKAAPARVFSRAELMERIYDDHRIVSERTINSHIKKLRRRLAELSPDRELIHSVYGAGYRYEDRPASSAPD